MKHIKPIQVGVPLLFRGTFDFDKKAIIDKFEDIAARSKNFDKYGYGDFQGDVGSSANNHDNQPHTWPELQPYYDWMLERSKEIFKLWEMEDDPYIDRSWINRYGKGGVLNQHRHANTDLIAVSYIQVPKNGGDLILVDPLEYHWFRMPSNNNLQMYFGQNIPVATNDVLFFAGFLRHSVEPNESDHYRWIISTNIRTKGY